MAWVVRRLLLPFAVGSVVCIILVFGWTTWASNTEVAVSLDDAALAALLVLPFEAVGLALLVPVALLVCDLALPRPLYPALLALIGAALGTVVVLPINDDPHFVQFTLPAIGGALSALVWFIFNRNAVRRRA